MEQKVNLKREDVNTLFQQYPIIGRGSEGTLFYMGSQIVYKIYHSYGDVLDVKVPAVYDEEGVNIAKIKKEDRIEIRKKNIIHYIDKEGVTLSKEDSLKKAIELQRDIKLSSLPKGIIYVNQRVKGCILKYHSYTTNIYNTRIYRRKIRLLIFKKILERIKELTEHNIYHLDICQKPTEESKNTNILLRFLWQPEVVDLEGKSTTYTEFDSEYLREKVELGLNILFFELLAKDELEDFLETEEHIMSEILWENGFSENIISDFYQNKLTLDKLNQHIEIMQRKLK